MLKLIFFHFFHFFGKGLIPVNAFSILQMLKRLLIYCLVFFLVLPSIFQLSAAAGPVFGSTCDRMLKRNEKVLRQVTGSILQTAKDNYDSLLYLYSYSFCDADTDDMSKLVSLQSELLCWVGTQTPCSDRAVLLLAESYFYQCDYGNVRRYLQLLQNRMTDSSLAAASDLLLLRTAIAESRWDEAESVMERHAAMNGNAGSGTETGGTFVLLEADFRLRTLADLNDKLDVLDELEKSTTLHAEMRYRVSFIRGQLQMRLGNYRAAVAAFSTVVNEAPKGGLYAYAHVYRDVCLENIGVMIRDSIGAEELRRTNRLPFEPTMVESCHDSAFIYALYPYYFQDMASRFFLEENEDASEDDEGESGDDVGDTGWYDDNDTTRVSPEMLSAVFDNWDSVSIHIPKADFSHLEDTIYLPLVDSGYSMPPFTAVTSEFGWRRYRYHYGVDTKNRTGDTIRVVFDGYVRIAKRSRTYGNVVVVRHMNGLETFYAHCSKLLVSQNDEVKAGDVLALVGSTGRSTGPHLHFEVRYKGVPFNPRHIIDFDSNKLRSDTLKITRETFNYLKPYGGSVSSASQGAVYYKVRPGDTLSQIARKYHTTVASIKRLNGLRSDFIRDGRRLRVR